MLNISKARAFQRGKGAGKKKMSDVDYIDMLGELDTSNVEPMRVMHSLFQCVPVRT